MSRQDLCHGREMGLHPLESGELLRALGRGLDGEAYIAEIHSSSLAKEGGLESQSPVRRLIINPGKTSRAVAVPLGASSELDVLHDSSIPGTPE